MQSFKVYTLQRPLTWIFHVFKRVQCVTVRDSNLFLILCRRISLDHNALISCCEFNVCSYSIKRLINHNKAVFFLQQTEDCNLHCRSSQPKDSLPSTGELMRMTRPMGEEDRIPRRRCSFFRKRLRAAVCDPWGPGVFSLRGGSDEWAMEAAGVSFHTHSTRGSAPGGGVYRRLDNFGLNRGSQLHLQTPVCAID